jgi:hypothetical protein
MPPLIGAIAAVVLYLIFIAGYMHTDIFPAMDCFSKDPCKTIKNLMDFYWPKTPEDYGKALVWSFIAGFSERLVPDLLQSIAKKQGKVGGKRAGRVRGFRDADRSALRSISRVFLLE